jgi:hypothetical protein
VVSVDETQLYFILGIVAALVIAIVVGYYYYRRTVRSSSASRLVEHDQELRTTAKLLLLELARSKSIFESKVSQYISGTDYWNDFPILPTKNYEELRNDTRIAGLGAELANTVNTEYDAVSRANEIFRAINVVIIPQRRELNFMANLFDAKWVVLRNCKIEFLEAYPVVESALRRIAES